MPLFFILRKLSRYAVEVFLEIKCLRAFPAFRSIFFRDRKKDVASIRARAFRYHAMQRDAA